MTLRQLQNAVANATHGQNLQSWLRAVSEISDGIAAATEGIYCGTAGTVREELSDMPGHFLVYGWCYGNIEYAYVS